jgi:hypothetical protein
MRVKHPRYANYHKIDKFMYVSGFSDGESRVRPVFSKQKTTKRSKKTEAGDGGGGGAKIKKKQQFNLSQVMQE